jgi:hypothetical protein
MEAARLGLVEEKRARRHRSEGKKWIQPFKSDGSCKCNGMFQQITRKFKLNLVNAMGCFSKLPGNLN